MSLSTLLAEAHTVLSKDTDSLCFLGKKRGRELILFFSLCDGKRRARVCHVRGADFTEVWRKGAAACQQLARRHGLEVRWLRVDWVTSVTAMNWTAFKVYLDRFKRNYFRYGLALGEDFKYAFLEQELNANAMLYMGGSVPVASFNERNFLRYARIRYGDNIKLNLEPSSTVCVFATEGLFVSEDTAVERLPGADTPQWLAGPGRNAGRRQVEKLSADDVFSLVRSSSEFLTRQVGKQGQFIYGHFPCFGRNIPTYNALRHASTTYSMVEAWEFTRDDSLLKSIKRALSYLTQNLIRRYPQSDGSVLAYNVDIGDEIKLGANAVSLLALVKYTEVTGDQQYLALMESLALGIARMQNQETGKFIHVLNAHDLSSKEAFRTIYYDGEAAFGLMRLYGLTRDARWLVIVERAFDYFLEAEHWKAHDHWLSYCANELTLYKPEEKYFRFGVQNIAGYLDFIIERITTYPTLLELSMAFHNMLERIRQHPEMQHVLEGLDIEKFYRALHHRAHYLLNGFFWPEFAMYFAKPSSVVGSFFIRHHSFRVRIDDVEHYLSGFVAYWKMLRNTIAQPPSLPRELPEAAPAAPTVGLLMYQKTPHDFEEVNAVAREAAKRGVGIFYFSYDAPFTAAGTVHGYAYREGKWVRHERTPPAVIDNAPPTNSSEVNRYRYLDNEAFLICHPVGGKKATFEALSKDAVAQRWLIPSYPLDRERADELLNQQAAIIVKPFRSSRGRNIFLLQRENGVLTLRTSDTERELTEDEYGQFVRDRANGEWLVQRYVEAFDPDGKASDIRVPVFRGRQGRWQIVRPYARIGTNSLTSNLATGGKALDAQDFLLRQFSSEQVSTILAQLHEAVLHMAGCLQEHYPFVIDALGFDFGLERGRPFLFEVNAYPGIKGCLDEAVAEKVSYYQTLLSVRGERERFNNRVAVLPRLASLQGDGGKRRRNDESSHPGHPPLRGMRASSRQNETVLRQIMAAGENDFSRSAAFREGSGNPVYALLRLEARKRGYTTHIVRNTHVEIRDKGELLASFSPNTPNLSRPVRAVVADKVRTKTLLQLAGVPVPAGKVFMGEREALAYFNAVSKPLTVKPANGYGGKGVTPLVDTAEEFEQAWQRAKRYGSRIVVEEFVHGDELRIIVIDGKVTAAVCRLPAYVIGDGRRSIRELVEEKNSRRKTNPLMRIYPIERFDYLKNVLNLTLDYVPSLDEYVRLATVSNVGQGGEAVSVIDVMHSSYFELARQAFHAIPQASMLGLDVITADITANAFECAAKVIEMNSDPGIGTPVFAAYGKPASDLPARLVDYATADRRDPPSVCHFQPARKFLPSCGGSAFPRTYGTQMLLLRQAAYVRGLTVVRIDSEATMISRQDERYLFIHGISGKTSLASRVASNDKDWCKQLLLQAGINTPKGEKFDPADCEPAWRFALKIGLPVVVKPLIGSGGKGVTVNVREREHFLHAWSVARSATRRAIIVEQQYDGHDYRVVVVGNKLVAVAQRIPAHVTGDGRSTISQLVAAKNRARQANPYHGNKPLQLTDTITRMLADQGLDAESVLADGHHLQLHAVANVGSGGESRDVTMEGHPDWVKVAVRARQAIFDPLHAGLDLIAEDIRLPPAEQKWAIIEVNTNPDLGVNHFPMHGVGRDVAGAILDELFIAEAERSPPAGARTHKARLDELYNVRTHSVRLTATGKVQSVGFRKWVWRAANRRGVSGWVRNSKDGKLEAVFSGAAFAVNEIFSLMRGGPAKAEVLSMELQPWNAEVRPGFTILK